MSPLNFSKLISLAERFVVAFERVADAQDRIAAANEQNLEAVQEALQNNAALAELLKEETKDLH